jgi:hypothetical protein
MSVDEKEKMHFHRITAPSITEALHRAKTLFSTHKIVAVINAKYENELG